MTAWFPGLLPRGIQSILCIYEGPASYAINGGYIWICSLLGVQRSNPCFGVMKGEETGKKKKTTTAAQSPGLSRRQIIDPRTMQAWRVHWGGSWVNRGTVSSRKGEKSSYFPSFFVQEGRYM